MTAQTLVQATEAPRRNPWWRMVCYRVDLIPHSGIVTWWNGVQVALFYFPETQRVYAVENRDPRSGANVIGRGIVGEINGDLVVAAPLYKQHFRLEDGSCVEDPSQRLRTWSARLHGWRVEIG